MAEQRGSFVDPVEAPGQKKLVVEAVRAVAARVKADPELGPLVAAFADDRDGRAIAAKCVEVATGGALERTPPQLLDVTTRARLVTELADQALGVVRAMWKAPDPRARLDQASIRELVANPLRCLLSRLTTSLERADHDDAAARALARLLLGQELPAALLPDLLPGIARTDVILALVAHASGDVVGTLAEILRMRRLAAEHGGPDQVVLVLYALWKLGPPARVRPIIVPFLRRSMRSARSLQFVDVLPWLARELDDPHATALAAELVGVDSETGPNPWVTILDDFMASPIAELVAALPDRSAEPSVPGIPARAAPRVGRNDLCPCGSGKKFKRCCADNPATVTVQGPSRADRLADLAPRLQAEQVALLARRDLAVLDLDRVPQRTLVFVFRRLAMQRDWTRAQAAVEALGRRPGQDADEWLDELIHDAITARRFDVAGALLPRLTSAHMRADAELTLALALDTPDALALLRRHARAAIDDDTGARAVDLGYAVIAAEPALGILLARAAIHGDRVLDSDMLLEAIEEARDELALPPWDAAHDLVATWDVADGDDGDDDDDDGESDDSDDDDDDGDGDGDGDTEDAALAERAAALRTEVAAAADRLAALQRQAAERERALALAEQGATAANQPERGPLRAKVDELKALIRAGNDERAELRRQLARATEAAQREAPPSHPRATAAADDRDVDLDLEAVPASSGARKPALPRFAVRAEQAFSETDARVAALALRHIGALAAGDAAAWRAVKQAKDMPRQVLMARIGIHHRLLFRCDAGSLDVLDLVTRESLLTTLKLLRSR